MNFSNRWLTALITFAIITFLAQMLRTYLPAKQGRFQSSKTLNELKKQYKNIELKAGIYFFLLTVFGGIGFYFLQIALSNWRFQWMAFSQFFVHHNEVFFLSSFFLGMNVGLLTAIFLTKKWVGKDNMPEYYYYNNLKYKFDYQRFSKPAIIIFTSSVMLLTVLLFDWCTIAEKDKVRINNFWSLGEKVYPVSKIKDIHFYAQFTAPNGNIINKPHFVITFSDATNWNSKESGFDNFKKDLNLVQYIATQAGKQIEFNGTDRAVYDLMLDK